MLIEITEKERTALSLLLGLRQKFAREKKEDQVYSAFELHKLFSELIKKINNEELKFVDTLRVAKPKKKPKDAIWGEVDDAIERSKIPRFNWRGVFGRNLTQEILHLKKSGHDVEETFKILAKDQRVLNFIEDNKRSKRKILSNLKISVHARFGENNTALKVMEAEDD